MQNWQADSVEGATPKVQQTVAVTRMDVRPKLVTPTKLGLTGRTYSWQLSQR